MEEVCIIGVNLAKNLFQFHGATVNGSVVFRKKLTRLQFERFVAAQPACAGAHHWARTLAGMGACAAADRAALRQALRQAPQE